MEVSFYRAFLRVDVEKDSEIDIIIEKLVISFVRRYRTMCDVEKYSKIYQEIKKLDPEDTLQLVLEAKDDEESYFYELIGNFLLQQRQRTAIKGNLF